MAEAVEKLRASGALKQTNFEIGNIILSGHSGGYHVMAAILDHGGLSEKIREVWLFDALYGDTENFVAWQKSENGRLLDIYTDHGGTKDETEKLMAAYKTNGVNFFAGEEPATARKCCGRTNWFFCTPTWPTTMSLPDAAHSSNFSNQAAWKTNERALFFHFSPCCSPAALLCPLKTRPPPRLRR